MKRTSTVASLTLAAALALTACGGTGTESEEAPSTPAASATATSSGEATASPSASSAHEGHEGMGGEHQHNPNGGPPPEGIVEASDPTYPVGSTVTLAADHMPGMQGSEATITGAFDTTAYSVTYTPTDGGEPVVDHKWVVQEELQEPGEPPLADGTQVVLTADHMAGMKGAEATIESSTNETVYMVDVDANGMKMTNHKWVVESEVEPAE
ncbi:MAG: YdhK family protein [Kocuria sp.]|nr:YdhK family protein [Kocuria sp.]